MSSYRVFVEDAASLKFLADLVSHIMHLPLSPLDVEAGPLFRGHTSDCMISVFDDHGLVDDSGIPFTKYRFEILLEPIEQLDGDLKCTQINLEPKSICLAEEIFTRLATHCMVVRGLQKVVRAL
jgi:hypothetical protein